MQLYHIKCIDENFILEQKIVNVICLRRFRCSQRSSRSGRNKKENKFDKIVVKQNRQNQKNELWNTSRSTSETTIKIEEINSVVRPQIKIVCAVQSGVESICVSEKKKTSEPQ